MRRDMDRLIGAFEALEVQGVYGFHNFFCCGGCASGGAQTYCDMHFPNAIGAVYYHEQSAENMVNGLGLYLYYGVLPRKIAHSKCKVGWMIMEALREQGLDAEWDGDPARAIVIPRFDADVDEIPEDGRHSTGSSLKEEDEDWDWDED